MPQQKDIFDTAPSIIDMEQAAPPQAAPQWQHTFEKLFPAQAQAAHQMSQIPQGLMNMAGSLSPLRFREGWDQPTLEVPQVLQGLAHPLDTLANTLGIFGTVGREAGALAAPNSVQAPSQQEMDQATQGATGLAATAMMPAIPEAATMAGIPQALSRAASLSDATPSWILRHPGAAVAKWATGPLLRAGSRVLFDPDAVPKTQNPEVNAEFVGAPTPPYQDVSYRTVPRVPKALPAPEAPPGQISGTAPPTQQLGTSMTHPSLPPAPAIALPGGSEGVPLTPDPRLPQAYADQPAAAPVAPPGMMVRGQIRLGEEGGVPATGEQTVTGIKPKPIRTTTGQMRKGTAEDVQANKGTPGRTVREPQKPVPLKKKS